MVDDQMVRKSQTRDTLTLYEYYLCLLLPLETGLSPYSSESSLDGSCLDSVGIHLFQGCDSSPIAKAALVGVEESMWHGLL